MSYFDCRAPECSASTGSVDLIVRPSRKDLGEFSVARALPSPERKMVGPFIFFDHMGPADFAPGEGIQVRPHPHIGIAAITYLFDGLVLHRDSLGFTQPIESAAVNLMVAGSGIVHSERAGDDLNERSHLHGIQSWMALPDGELERDPEFVHYPATQIPEFAVDGARIRLIIGRLNGQVSPVKSFVDTLYLEALLAVGGRLSVPAEVPELAAYLVSGEAVLDGHVLTEGTMAIAHPGATLHLEARTDCRLMVLGGAPVGDREIWWNFVAPTTARIEQAKRDWRDGRFALIDGDDEFIPLPED
jgi:redox-sensitive bicupin YhaK (pirin superfamily)